MARALSVAKEFVRLSFAGEEPDPLTNLRLQKLLYYSQAWSLVVRGGELFPEELRAWRHGPVVPDVYHALPAGYGANPIGPDPFAAAPDPQPDEAAFARRVWDSYKGFSALKLSEMTHAEAPWQKAWGDRPRDGAGNEPIDVAALEDYFSGRPVPPPLAAFAEELERAEAAAARRVAALPQFDPDRLLAAASDRTWQCLSAD